MEHRSAATLGGEVAKAPRTNSTVPVWWHLWLNAATRTDERSSLVTSPLDEKPSPGRFTELSEAACKELLGQHTAGRVGFLAPQGPQILPVTYQYRNGNVIFR